MSFRGGLYTINGRQVHGNGTAPLTPPSTYPQPMKAPSQLALSIAHRLKDAYDIGFSYTDDPEFHRVSVSDLAAVIDEVILPRLVKHADLIEDALSPVP